MARVLSDKEVIDLAIKEGMSQREAEGYACVNACLLLDCGEIFTLYKGKQGSVQWLYKENYNTFMSMSDEDKKSYLLHKEMNHNFNDGRIFEWFEQYSSGVRSSAWIEKPYLKVWSLDTHHKLLNSSARFFRLIYDDDYYQYAIVLSFDDICAIRDFCREIETAFIEKFDWTAIDVYWY